MVVKKIVSEISNRRKYVHGKKGKLETPHKKLKQWQPDGKMGKFSRIAGLGAIDLSWFLFCLGKYTAKDLNTVLLDNKIIDTMQKKHKNLEIQDSDSKFKQFFKKIEKSNPRTAATLKLWMLYSLLTIMSIGGIKLAQRDKDNSGKQVKTEQVIDNNNPKDVVESAIIYEEEENSQKVIDDTKKTGESKISDDVKTPNVVTYDISDVNFADDFLDDNWDDIVVSLLEFETWRDKAKLHSGESRYTYGPGVTWVYIKNKNGKIVQHACVGDYVQRASNFSVEQKLQQVRYHCGHETLPGIKRQLAKYGFTNITDQQALGLFVVAYQLPGSLSDNYKNKKFISKGIVHKLSDAESNIQKQVDAFIAGTEVPEKWRTGTNKRRWWCAMIYMGYITTDDLINLDRDAFTSININTILKNGHFVYDAATIEYVLAHANNPNRNSVKDFMKERNISMNKNFSKHQKNNLNNDAANPSMKKTNEGLKAFKAKNYNLAISCYQKAIALDANNMEAYSSLALSYKKLGDQTHSIADYKKAVETVKACNAQMNRNRNLLHDPEVKASTYYNAGLAREEMAKLYEKDNNIEQAIENYNKAKQNFETAYANAEEFNSSERMTIYKQAQQRVEKSVETLQIKNNQTNKRNAFGQGKTKLLNKMANQYTRNTGNTKD